jgi:hypothetical protein
MRRVLCTNMRLEKREWFETINVTVAKWVHDNHEELNEICQKKILIILIFRLNQLNKLHQIFKIKLMLVVIKLL